MSEKETIRVWFCSPDAGFAQAVVRALGSGIEVRVGEKLGLDRVGELAAWWDVALLDLRMETAENGMGAGLRLIEQINQMDSRPPAIVILGADAPALTSKAMEHGAYDALASPPDMIELRLALRRAHRFGQMEKDLRRLRSSQGSAGGQLEGLIGPSESMQQVFAMAKKIAPCDVTVLVTGETGTGKELLARAIHQMSPRAAYPFAGFSCANLPDTLIEDELFGHEKGAFTGALTMRRGRLEMADRGTLFLDEVGDLSLGLQPKLLRVLQERAFERLGGSTPVTVNIRLVCATNQNVEEMVKQGKFREDLYYRLNVVQIHLPPLRERRDEIPLLANHFLQKFAGQFNKKSRRLSRPVLQALEEYTWPGNVRELENVVQRAVALADRPTIEVWDLPTPLRNGFQALSLPRSYEEEVREFRRRLLLRALRESGWRKSETARKLGLARNYLHRLINQLDLRPEDEDLLGKLLDPPPSDRVM